jgi:hypothetical protein
MAANGDVNQSQTESEAVLSPVEKLIMAKLDSTGGKIDKLTSVMERMEANLFVLQQENDRLKKEVAELREKGVSVQEASKAAVFRAQRAESMANFNEQYSRNYNLRIYFVPEPENESVHQCQETVIKLFHNKLGLKDISKKDLDAVHRLGPKNTGKTRGIIVRFVNRQTRDEVIQNRRKLKKSPNQTTPAVVIVEDLTKQNYQLYQRARMAENTQQCWTSMGKVFIKTKSGEIKRIRNQSDVEMGEKQTKMQQQHQRPGRGGHNKGRGGGGTSQGGRGRHVRPGMPFDVHPRRRSRNHASQVLFGDDSASEMDTELVSDFEDNLDNEKDNQSDTWR